VPDSLTVAVRQDDSADVVLVLGGKCSGGSLGELRRAIENARRLEKNVILDLSEVTLVDRPSLQFFASQVRENVTLINCPEYIEPWIFRESSQ
jgi:hypothetical protein